MGRSLIGLTAVIAAASAIQPAAAQDAKSASISQPWDAMVSAPPAPVMAGRWNSGIVGPWSSGTVGSWTTNATEGWRTALTAPAAIGFELAPGMSFVPKAFSEIGFDTNPAQSLSAVKNSAFTRDGAGFNLTSVSPGMIASLNGAGSFTDYFNDAVFADARRYAGSANASVTHLVQPGATLLSGAFVNYDGESASKNQTDGANAELALGGGLLTSNFRLSFRQVEYLNGKGIADDPLILGSAFNYNRSEVAWLGLLGGNWTASPYADVSAARVDYTDQPAGSHVDRSADDYHAKAGVRLHLSPELTADIGWRVNVRDTEDHRVGSFDSNGFDGSLTWKPSPFFNFTAAAERSVGEPATTFAVLSDMRSYTLKAGYLPVPGVTVSAVAGWIEGRDIGSGVSYQLTQAWRTSHVGLQQSRSALHHGELSELRYQVAGGRL